jgi:hypothetical protein
MSKVMGWRISPSKSLGQGVGRLLQAAARLIKLGVIRSKFARVFGAIDSPLRLKAIS